MAAMKICLRNGHRRDIARMVQLLTDPQVRVHLGGSKSRVTAWPLAIFNVALARRGRDRWAQIIADASTGRMLGTVMVDRRRANRPGHVHDGGRELELSYVLLPDTWGRGAAGQASRLLLSRVASELREDQPVLVVTQSSNNKALTLACRLGFEPCGEFTEFGAAQTMLATQLHGFLA